MQPMRNPVDDSDSFISEIRLANVARLVDVFLTKAAFCRASEMNASQVGQFFQPRNNSGYRNVGPKVSRKIEKALQLPEFSLDKENGVEPHLVALAERFELRRPAVRVEQAPGSTAAQDLRAKTAVGLSPLQIATLDSLNQAMRDNRFSDKDCVALLAKLIGDTGQGDERP